MTEIITKGHTDMSDESWERRLHIPGTDQRTHITHCSIDGSVNAVMFPPDSGLLFNGISSLIVNIGKYNSFSECIK